MNIYRKIKINLVRWLMEDYLHDFYIGHTIDSIANEVVKRYMKDEKKAFIDETVKKIDWALQVAGHEKPKTKKKKV